MWNGYYPDVVGFDYYRRWWFNDFLYMFVFIIIKSRNFVINRAFLNFVNIVKFKDKFYLRALVDLYKVL